MDKMERRSYEYPRCLIGNDYAEVVLWTGIMAKPVKHHQKLSPLKVSSETKTRNHIEMCVYDPVDKHFNRLVDYDDNSRHSPHFSIIDWKKVWFILEYWFFTQDSLLDGKDLLDGKCEDQNRLHKFNERSLSVLRALKIQW